MREELRLYKEELGTRQFVVAANKMDCDGAQANFAQLQKHVVQAGFSADTVLPMAASKGQGVLGVTSKLRAVVEEAHDRARTVTCDLHDSSTPSSPSPSPRASHGPAVSEAEMDEFDAALLAHTKKRRKQR